MSDEDKKNRTLRAEDSLWEPFVELTLRAEKLGAAVVIRRFIMAYLEDFGVFYAPVSKDDPTSRRVAFYECTECDTSHRLDGSDGVWGCSVVKARSDRLAKAAS